jgi:hypothetical protein
MGIGPQGLGSMGMKKGVHGCGSPMNKIVETSGVETNRYKSMKDRRRKKNLNQKAGKEGKLKATSVSLNKAKDSLNKQLDSYAKKTSNEKIKKLDNLGNSYWHSKQEN